jgi:hypothetical protein
MNHSQRPTCRLLRFAGATLASLVLLVAAWSGQGRDSPGILKLSVVDDSSRQAMPARVELLDRDGKAYLAEDGLLIGGD